MPVVYHRKGVNLIFSPGIAITSLSLSLRAPERCVAIPSAPEIAEPVPKRKRGISLLATPEPKTASDKLQVFRYTYGDGRNVTGGQA